jgi:hypothetical protein
VIAVIKTGQAVVIIKREALAQIAAQIKIFLP